MSDPLSKNLQKHYKKIAFPQRAPRLELIKDADAVQELILDSVSASLARCQP